MKTNRIYNIDLLKGFTISLVVLFHLTNFHRGAGGIKVYVLPFFMQLFFFTSGLFFSSKKDFKEFSLNKVNRLIVPLLFFYFFNYFLGFLSQFVLKNNTVDKFSPGALLDIFNGKEYFTYAGAIWFLCCLLILNFLFYVIMKIRNKYGRLIIVVFLTILGYFLSYYKINLPYFIDSAFSMSIYFYLGIILRRQSFFIEKQKIDVFTFIILSIVFILIVLNLNITTKIMSNVFEGNFILITFTTVIGIYIHFILSKWINKINVINFIGKNSLIILVTHQVLIVFFSVLLKKIGIESVYLYWLNFGCTMITELGIIVFLNKYFPYLVGKKNVFNF